MKNYKKQIYLFLCVSLFIVIGSFAVLFFNFRKQVRLQNEILKIEANLVQADSLTANLLQIESDKRGFQLTNDANYLKNFYRLKLNSNGNVAKLKKNIIAGADTGIISQIDSLLQLRIANLDSGIFVFTTKGFDASIAFMQIKGKKNTRELLNQKLDLLKDHLLRRLEENTSVINSRSNRNLTGLLILLSIFVALLLVAARTFRRAQQKIIKNHIKLKEAQHIARIGSWEWDIATNKLIWSQEQFRLFGEDRKKFDLTLEGYLSHLSVKEQEYTLGLIKAALEGKANYAVEHEIMRRDGTKLMVFEQGSVLFDDDKKPTGMFGTTQDITDRKKTEEELQLVQKKFQQIFDNTADGIYQSTIDGKFIMANTAMAKMFGYKTPDELICSITDIGAQIYADAGDRQRMSELLARKDHVENFEAPLLTKKGDIVWVSESTRAVRNEKGGIRYFEGTLKDISDRKKAEKKVADFMFALDQSSIVDVSDPNGEIQYVNENFCRISGYSSEELKGKNHRVLKSGYHSNEHYKNLWETVLSGKVWRSEVRNKAKDGSFYWTDTTIVPFVNEDGKPFQFVTIRSDITERKKTEEALNSSKEQYRQIVETAQEGIWVLDENNYTIFVNKKMCEILEYSREEIMGKQNYYFKDEEGKKKAMQDIERRKGGMTETQVSKFIAKSGKIVWTSLSTNPIFDDEGKYVGALGMFTDITERKKADDELLLAQKKFKEIFDNTADGIYQSTIDGKFLIANPSMARIFGYDSPEELIRSVTDISKQIYADPVERKKMAAIILAEGHVENYVLKVLTKNKNAIWVSANIRIVRDEKGGISCFEGTLEDITERKKVEEQLLNLSNRLQLAVRATSIGIWDWDIAKNNTVWDEEMYRIYNVSPDDPRTITEAWEAAVHADDLERVNEELQMAIKGEKEYDTEFRVIWKDKTIHYVAGNALVQRDQSGNALRMIGTNTDITERKEAELEILQLNRNLDQFANITAHDLQEPIRMVSGFLGLLDKKYYDIIDEQGKSYIYRAKDGADRMSILIRDLLEFSRSGNKAAKKEPVDLKHVMDLVNKDLTIVVADTHAILKTPACLPVVTGTQSALYRLFLNLISNGIKFRKKDTAPRITLAVNELPGFWEFTLQDNGIGVAEKDQPKLFHAFQRLHRKEEYPGTGLGLVTCKKIVETHGGKIWMTSEVGKGTTFHFTISKSQ